MEKNRVDGESREHAITVWKIGIHKRNYASKLKMSKDFQRPQKMAQEFLKETLATANKTCTVILWDHLMLFV